MANDANEPDKAQPRIEHLVEQFGPQVYNYLVYRFERGGFYVVSRTDMLDGRSTISSDVFNKATDMICENGEAPELRTQALSYLRLRYRRVMELGSEGVREIP